MKKSKNPGRWFERLDFKYILPIIGKMPLPLGLAGAYLRGLINYFLDYDWRSQAVGFPFVRDNTKQAFQILKPGYNSWRYSWLTVQRFMHNSREEWQATLFARSVMNKIKVKSSINGLEEMLALQKAGRGIVIVSIHLDSFCMGMALLGMHGLKIHCVNTKAGVEDPRINPVVTSFLQTKYQNMENLMSGRMEYYETNMQFFYKALEKGETVALMGDVPGSKTTIHLNFAGKKIPMPLGAWKMAVQTKSFLAGYVCLMNGLGKYEVKILKPFEPDPDSPEKSMLPIYNFLEQFIRAYPARWVAADIMAAYSDG